MKVGDKLYCKKTLKTLVIDDQVIHFFKGRYYEIVNYKIQDGVLHYVLKSELSYTCHIPENSKYIGEYFYTEKELRKMKLDKISGRLL